MHKITLLFLSVFLLIFISCDENNLKEEHNTSTKMISHKNKTFDLTGIFNQRYKFSIQQDRIKITHTKPIVIVNIFTPFSASSTAQMENLNQLQKEYHKDTFTLSLSLKESTKKTLLDLTANHNLNYFIVNTTQESKNLARLLKKQTSNAKNYILPLTIIYLKGEYFTHYEGIIPLEMMRYDLIEAKKNLKSKN